MKVTFWGVRGSTPVPMSSAKFRERLVSVFALSRPRDLESSFSRSQFLSSLDDRRVGAVGGNSTCVECDLENGKLLVFDMGTGLRSFDENVLMRVEPVNEVHIFMTHFHYDHIMGLLFFRLAYNPNVKIHIYSPLARAERLLRNFMRPPYHPVTMDSFLAQIEFHHLTGESLALGGASISWKRRAHPNGCYAYRIEENGKVFIFSTDTELEQKDFEKTEENKQFFQKADLIVLDSQYSLGEALEKVSWGHTSYSMAVEFCLAYEIKRYALFHHEPLYDDQALYANRDAATWYSKIAAASQGIDSPSNLKVILAKEGESVTL